MDASILNRVLPFCIVLILAFSAIGIPIVLVHALLGSGDNESLETASIISDPTKSWAIYTSLSSDGHPQYYTFNISEGQTITVILYKSTRSQDAAFTPRLVLIGPNIIVNGEIPSEITVPANTNARLVELTPENPTFKPFSPGTLVNLGDVTLEIPRLGSIGL
jgi:hypothetical protein